MIQTRCFRAVAVAFLFSLALLGRAQAQADYGYTEFEASGSPEAHQVFLRGLLQLHNLRVRRRAGLFPGSAGD